MDPLSLDGERLASRALDAGELDQIERDATRRMNTEEEGLWDWAILKPEVLLNLIWQIRSLQSEIQKQQVQLQECILATSSSYVDKEQGQVGYSNALQAVQSLRHKGEMSRKEERESIV